MKTNLNVDAQALREKILDLAMRGKLVKQDAGDEPAGVLLEKIKAEKAELVKEGKIKKSKKLPEITEDEKPFDIPDSWEWVRLGDILSVSSGQSLTRDNMTNGDIPVYGGNGIAGYHDIAMVNHATIVIGRVGFNCGSVHLTEKKAWVTDNALMVSYVKKYINRSFLIYSLQYLNLGSYSSSTAQPVISAKKIYSISLPLPPLNEQGRIAEKVGNLFKQVDVIEKNVSEYQDLEQAMRSKLLDLAMRGKLVEQDPNDEPASELLKQIQAEKAELVKKRKIKKSKKLPEITDNEKPFDIPDSWEWVRLGNITIITSGGTPSKSKKEYWESGDIPWITPALMGKAKHKTYKGETGYINKIGLSNSSAKLIPKNSIVYSSRAPIGHINVVPFDYTTNQGCKSVTPINENIDFLYYTLMQQTPNIISRASGTTFKEISGSKFAETPIPLPPLAEQKRIADKLTRLFEDLDTIKQNLATVS